MARLTHNLRNLTSEKAKDALYVDFEGLGRRRDGTSPRPTFLGVLQKNCYSGLIFEEELSSLSKGSAGFPGPRTIRTDMDLAILELVHAAAAEDRLILYFSQHEKEMVEAHCSREVAVAFQLQSANAKLLIQRWANTRPVQVPEESTLEDFCTLAGIRCPQPPEPGVAETIRRLRSACSRISRWSHLSPAHQGLARELFTYNRDDCRALKLLTIKATRYFETRVQPLPQSPAD